jgi:DNA polymerase III subunit delta
VNHTDLLRDLKAKKYRPVYLLQGEEAYYIDLVSDYFADKVLADAEKAFNQTILYGKDTNWQTVQDNVRQLPFMGDRKVVIVKEAQSMKDFAELAKYCEKPVASTILVLCYKYGVVDKRTKIAKILAENAVILDSNKIYDNQLPDWISRYLQERNLKIDGENANLLAESLGNDLSKVANELQKLALNVAANTMVTADIIQQYIGISKEFNIFELQAALAKRDTLKVFRIANYFAANAKDNPLVKSLGSLYTYFSKVYIATTKLHTNDDDLAKALGMRFPKFAAEYRTAAKNYPRPQVEQRA